MAEGEPSGGVGGPGRAALPSLHQAGVGPQLQFVRVREFEGGVDEEEFRRRLQGLMYDDEVVGMYLADAVKDRLHVVRVQERDGVEEQDLMLGLEEGRQRCSRLWWLWSRLAPLPE